MPTKPNLQSIIPILEQNGVKFAGLFGSHARGEAREDSDIDILIGFKKAVGLFGLTHLGNLLTDQLKKLT